MAYTPEQRAADGRRGGLTRSQNLTPERRSEIARKAAAASHEANRKRREGMAALRVILLEQGWTDEQIEAEYGIKKRAAYGSRQKYQARPSAEELEPYLREVDEAFPEGLTYDQRVREATLRLKVDRQRAIEDGLR